MWGYNEFLTEEFKRIARDQKSSITGSFELMLVGRLAAEKILGKFSLDVAQTKSNSITGVLSEGYMYKSIGASVIGRRLRRSEHEKFIVGLVPDDDTKTLIHRDESTIGGLLHIKPRTHYQIPIATFTNENAAESLISKLNSCDRLPGVMLNPVTDRAY